MGSSGAEKRGRTSGCVGWGKQKDVDIVGEERDNGNLLSMATELPCDLSLRCAR